MSGSADEDEAGEDVSATDRETDLERLREQVEAEYDFENFGPADMAQMSAEEWEAVFDPDSWVVGERLLERVERDLRSRIAARDVFAVLERTTYDGENVVLAYSDEGYAIVYPDGSVEGEGTVLRDVKPTVALCSMPDYEVPEAPADGTLPDPESVSEGSGEFGNLMLQVVAFAQLIAGIGLFLAWLLTDLSTIVAPAIAIVFVIAGLFLFLVVANARLSDRFRAEEFRDRLRATGVGQDGRPEFVPTPDSVESLESGDTGDDSRQSVDGNASETDTEAPPDRGE